MAARRRLSRKRKVSRKRRSTKRRVSRKKRVTRKRRKVSRKKRVVKRRKARKPVKKETGTRQSVWDGKAKRTRLGKAKVSLCMLKGKVVDKSSLIGTMSQVFRGTKQKTKGGLVKKDLMKNKNGKVCSKKRHAFGKRVFKKTGIQKWTKAVQQARKDLGIKGFYAIKKGTPLYKAARAIYDA